jgi:hypothetical protein
MAAGPFDQVWSLEEILHLAWREVSVRTFPRELAAFRIMVEQRGSRLRQLSFAELQGLADKPLEHVAVESRKATIGTIVLPSPGGGIQVVLQGFMEHRFMAGNSVAMDGFHKYPDQTVSEMKPEEFWKFN